MRKASFFLTFALTVVFVWFIGTADLAAESYEEEFYQPVAQVSIGANGIAWSPKVNYASIELRVSGPDGYVFSKTFGAGESLYLGLSDNNGKYFTDGSYTYELRVNPVESNRVRTSEDSGLSESLDASSQQALIQSGSFRVLGSNFVTTSGPEGGLSTTLDQVINDDLIVTFSACIGNDCTNGENFGFDTLRLKENNLRIKFDDTSNSGSFPNNDWQLTANDSNNGGLNKFSIDDITGGKTPFTIEAGAPTNSLYVDDGGRVGLGTSTPVVELHVVDGDSPALRLEQNGSSGFTAQTWDVAGNETNFFVRDVTHSSKIPFKIKPSAPTNSLFINSDGKIGLGTASPSYPMELSKTGSAATFVANQTDGATAMISAGASYVFIGALSNNDFRLLVNDQPRMTIDTSGEVGIGTTSPNYPLEVATANGAYLNTSGNWVNPSSRTLKENIKSLTAEEAITTLNALNPVKYNYKVDKTEQYVGFIAEDVPDLVAVNNRKGMVPMDVVAVLTKVVKEQQKIITELKNEIDEIKKK